MAQREHDFDDGAAARPGGGFRVGVRVRVRVGVRVEVRVRVRVRVRVESKG